jgi:uncharacterized OB-fold protein
MGFLGDLIREHGWHVLGELAVLAVTALVAAYWIRALLQGRARPVVCGSCGRVASRAHASCPRCGERLEASG